MMPPFIAPSAAPIARRAPVGLALTYLLTAAILAGVPASAAAQQPLAPSSDGPVIHGYGAVYDIADPDLVTPTDHVYRIVFEVAESGAEPGAVNPYLNTLARFLNMHARAGVPRENMQLALVLHGTAAKDALRSGLFRERYGTENENLDLLRQLAGAGVEIYMCGQSAMARGLPPAELAEPVRMALSAMTAMEVLKERGFRTVN